MDFLLLKRSHFTCQQEMKLHWNWRQKRSWGCFCVHLLCCKTSTSLCCGLTLKHSSDLQHRLCETGLWRIWINHRWSCCCCVSVFIISAGSVSRWSITKQPLKLQTPTRNHRCSCTATVYCSSLPDNLNWSDHLHLWLKCFWFHRRGNVEQILAHLLSVYRP